MNQGVLIGAVLAGILVLVWLVTMLARRNRSGGGIDEVSPRVREALTVFAEQSLELPSVEEILFFASEAAKSIFGVGRIVVLERGGDDGGWEASVPRQDELGAVPSNLSGLFGWFVHNSAIASRSELGESRFGAMRRPLGALLDQYDIDVVMPLVERGRLLASIGFKLGRAPTDRQRLAMRLFRLAATAACANVRLHREAAHLVTLAKEVDLASAVQLALAPERPEGQDGAISWAGHYQAAGDASSDFWATYPIGGERVLVIIGDAVGRELAGAMVSAVVKSCTDTMFEQAPGQLAPSVLLESLNRALYRSSRPAQTSCFAALFDPHSGRMDYANAGHVIPYQLRFSGSGVTLGALIGSGPMLGDTEDATYKVNSLPLTGSASFVFFTDGLTKVRDSAGKEFRDRRLQRLLQSQGSNDARAIRDAIVAAAETHRGEGSLRDDLALVVVSSSLG
ncbi:MAG: serine/threonine-protein phosphatase [Deltaproteobacteria bacterium]|nr:serine/threonine-protein phosphatase [Deltaproteobacteria bacterium]